MPARLLSRRQLATGTLHCSPQFSPPLYVAVYVRLSTPTPIPPWPVGGDLIPRVAKKGKEMKGRGGKETGAGFTWHGKRGGEGGVRVSHVGNKDSSARCRVHPGTLIGTTRVKGVKVRV